MKQNKRSTHGKKNPLYILMIALSVTLAMGSISLVYAIMDISYDYQPSESSLLYSLQDSDYTRLRSQMAYYSQEEIASDQGLTECYNVALYFENSVMYYAFLEVDPEQAAFYQAAANANADLLGDLSYQKDLIDAILTQ